MTFSKNVFCESAFLEKMCQAAEENSQVKYEDKKVWRSLWNLIYYETVEFHISLSEQEWEKTYKEANRISKNAAKRGQPIPMYANLIRRLQDAGYCDQQHIQMLFGYRCLTPMSKGIKDGIYLTMLKRDQCKLLQERTGQLIISPDNICDFEPLTNDNGLPIPKGYFGTWEKILRESEISKWGRLPCRFITIVDNYLLKDTNVIKENLASILSSLLPQSSTSTPFPLKIISCCSIDFENIWGIVCNIIDEINRPYPISLCIVKCNDNTFHDRTIYTDNIWIGCGGGFDLFKKKKASKSTLINIVSPFLNDRVKWAFKAYANLVEMVNKKTGKDCPNYDELGCSDNNRMPFYKREGITGTFRN